MSFSKVNPPGWAFGDKLTSAQMNQLDADHANALDKSVAGDTLLGTIGILSVGAAIVTATPAGIQSQGTDGIYTNTFHGIRSDVAGGIYTVNGQGIRAEVANGIVPTVAGGISDGGVAQGIKATVSSGIISAHIGGISTTVAGGISDGVTGGITLGQQHGLTSQTSGGNGILLAGGNEYIDYQVARGKNRIVPLAMTPFSGASPPSPGTGWSYAFASGPALIGGATTNVLTIVLNSMLSGDVNGAKLSQAALIFSVTGTHVGLPTLPFFNIVRQPMNGGSSPGGAVSLFAGGTQSMGTTTGAWTAPASAGAWNASGNIQQFGVLPNQNNNPIDLTQYMYYVTIQDESGANSIAGNLYFAVKLTFQNITNSEPG